MKKILILTLISILSTVYANAYSDRNSVYLDLSGEKPFQKAERIPKVQKIKKSAKVNSAANAKEKEQETLIFKDVNRLQEEQKPVSKAIEKEVFKNTSVGAAYSANAVSGELKDKVSVFSKYQKEHFGLTTSYSQNREGFKENGVGSGTVSFAPEIALNKHIKLKNVYSDNMANNQQSNDLVLSLTPFKDDRLDLDLGAGQTFSTSNEPAKSHINIGTRFRF